MIINAHDTRTRNRRRKPVPDNRYHKSAWKYRVLFQKNSVPNCMSDAPETGTGFLVPVFDRLPCVMAIRKTVLCADDCWCRFVYYVGVVGLTKDVIYSRPKIYNVFGFNVTQHIIGGNDNVGLGLILACFVSVLWWVLVFIFVPVFSFLFVFFLYFSCLQEFDCEYQCSRLKDSSAEWRIIRRVDVNRYSLVHFTIKKFIIIF